MAVSYSCRWLAASAGALIFLAPALAQDTVATITVDNTTVGKFSNHSFCIKTFLLHILLLHSAMTSSRWLRWVELLIPIATHLLTPILAVDASTLAPAAVTVSNTTTADGTTLTAAETVQLTDEVVANLTNIALTNATLFAFDDGNSTTLDKRSGSCKVFPGDTAWPSTLVWWVFDLLLGGRLITTVPLASSCYTDFDNYDAATCTDVDDNWTNSTMQ